MCLLTPQAFYFAIVQFLSFGELYVEYDHCLLWTTRYTEIFQKTSAQIVNPSVYDDFLPFVSAFSPSMYYCFGFGKVLNLRFDIIFNESGERLGASAGELQRIRQSSKGLQPLIERRVRWLGRNRRNRKIGNEVGRVGSR